MTTTETLTHRCLSGGRCVNTVVEDGKRLAAVTAKPNTLCDSCIRRVRNAIEDLPFDYVSLHVSLGERTGDAGARVNSTRTPPLPIDKGKYALMTQIAENLERAAEIVSDALNCNPPIEGKEHELSKGDPPMLSQALRVERCATMVSTNIYKLLDADEVSMWVWERCDQRCGKNGCDAGEHLRLSDKSGIEFARTLKDLHQRARAAVGEFEKVLRVPTPCGACGAPFLFQHPGTQSVTCRDCGQEWGEQLLSFAGKLILQRQQEEADAKSAVA